MIIKNAIITPDGTELISEHRHDFKMYKDSITGKEYGVDGGCEYQRLIGDMNDCKVILIEVDEEESFTPESFDMIRNSFKWGSRGKDGKQPLVQKKLKELSNAHIEAIIKTQTHISKTTKHMFLTELSYRNLNKISIED